MFRGDLGHSVPKITVIDAVAGAKDGTGMGRHGERDTYLMQQGKERKAMDWSRAVVLGLGYYRMVQQWEDFPLRGTEAKGGSAEHGKEAGCG